MLSTQERIASEQVADRVYNFAPEAGDASYAMKVYDTVVHMETDDTTAGTLTLPNVSEAKGRFYTIVLITDGGVDVTVQDNDESMFWSDLTFGDANDLCLLYSDGVSFHVIYSTGI